MDLDVARYMLTDSSQRNSNKENVVADSPVKKALNEIVFQNRTRILAFKSRPPAPAESVSMGVTKVSGLLNDYYLNLLDWSCTDILAIALRHTIYLCIPSKRRYCKLTTINEDNGLVTSINWDHRGDHIAVGLENSEVQLWDINSTKKVRVIANSSNSPLHKIEDHLAAVKALAWCPFQSNLLASGGGGADRCIKFWNTHNGACLKSVDTGPDGRTVASAGADEEMRFWQVFGTSKLLTSKPRYMQWVLDPPLKVYHIGFLLIPLISIVRTLLMVRVDFCLKWAGKLCGLCQKVFGDKIVALWLMDKGCPC
ncbi:hypothetical protein AMTRI_Chr05g69880 [Amborella trichopoda]